MLKAVGVPHLVAEVTGAIVKRISIVGNNAGQRRNRAPSGRALITTDRVVKDHTYELERAERHAVGERCPTGRIHRGIARGWARDHPCLSPGDDERAENLRTGQIERAVRVFAEVACDVEQTVAGRGEQIVDLQNGLERRRIVLVRE